MAPDSHETSPGRTATAVAGAAMGRRRAMVLIAGAGAATLAACGRSGGGDSDASAVGRGESNSTSADARGPEQDGSGPGQGGGGGPAASNNGNSNGDAIPEETAGPYPGDGSNGPDILTQDGVVRRDIRSSFGSATGVAAGVPLTVELTIVDAGEEGVEDSTPLPGATVYLWHCTRDGQYSLYSESVAEENFLRGVQEADSGGRVTFTTIFPGAYSGRWPHIHFEVYPSVADATSAGTPLATSQLALPEDTCDLVYATAGYDGSTRNMGHTSLGSDNVFGDDGADEQLATVTGSVDAGFVAQLTVPVSVA